MTVPSNNGLKTCALIATLGLASSLAPQVQADPKPYLGVGFGFFEYAEDGLREEAVIPGFYGRAGIEFIDNVSAEIRAGSGAAEDEVDVLGTKVDVELDYFVGAYLRGSLPIHETIQPYAIIGGTKGELTASANGFTTSASENDLSFGFGVDVGIDDRSEFNLEYMSYLDKDEGEVSALTASVVAKF